MYSPAPVTPASKLSIILLICLSVATMQRNVVWASTETMWKDINVKSPGKIRGYLNLGQLYQTTGRLNLAIPTYLDGLRRCEDKRKYDETTQMLPYKVNLCDGIASNMGSIFLDAKDHQTALMYLKKAVEGLPPDGAYINMGVLMLRTNQPQMALYWMVKVREQIPEWNYNMGEAYRLMGDCNSANQYYKKFSVWYPERKVPSCPG